MVTSICPKLLSLVVGCVAKFITGSVFSFNLYQDAIKDKFNYTQKEVEVLSSMLNLGLGMGFVPGVFYDKFGPRQTSAMSAVVSVSFYLLIWSATRYRQFYFDKSWLLAVYFYMCGLGSVFSYMAALNTNLINFHEKHAGKIVGLLNACFAGSGSIFAVIYYNYFVSGNPDDFKSQNFEGFMLFLAILFGVMGVLCILFLRITGDSNGKFSQLEEDTAIRKEPCSSASTSATNCSYGTFVANEHNLLHSSPDRIVIENTGPCNSRQGIAGANSGFFSSQERFVVESSGFSSSQEKTIVKDSKTCCSQDCLEENSEICSSRQRIIVGGNGEICRHEANVVTLTTTTTTNIRKLPLTLKEILLHKEYHLLTWMFGFASCVAVVYGNNITVISRSVHLDQYNSSLTILIPIAGGLVSLFIGCFSDFFVQRIPRMMILLVACGISLVAQVLVIAFADMLWLLILATVLTGLGMSTLWAIAPTIMREWFYVGNIGRNWGIAVLLAALLGFGSQEVFGAVYDAEITVPGETQCYGMKCIQGGIGLLIGLNSVAVVIGGFLYIKTK